MRDGDHTRPIDLPPSTDVSPCPHRGKSRAMIRPLASAPLFGLLVACANNVLPEEPLGPEVVNPSAEGALTMLPCGAPLAEFDGTVAYSNGDNTGTGVACAGAGGVANGLRYQCVELVMRHFKVKWGLRWYGHAKSLLDGAPLDRVDVYENGDAAHPPVPGDMLVWENGKYGHVALITAVRPDAIDVIEQNVAGDGKATFPYDGATVGARWSTWTPAGWAHAKANVTALPAGENVAPASVELEASGEYGPDWGPARATDGVVAADSKWVSGGEAQPWLSLDLGAEHNVTGFAIAHASAAGESRLSDLASARMEVGASLAGPWQALAEMPSAFGGRSVRTLPAAVRARYVRLVVLDAGGDAYARLPELEVYSIGASADLPTNVAPSAAEIWTSSDFGAEYSGAAAVDGIVSAQSKWTSDGESAESWIAFDLGLPRSLTSVVVKHAGAAGEQKSFNTRFYRLEVGGSAEGPWQSVASVDNTGAANVIETDLNDLTSRFLRLVVTDAGIDDHARIPEIEVWAL